MAFNMRRTIKTLIYKNYLVSKRQWKTTVFVEILLPMFLIWLACEINSSFYKHLTSRSTPDHDFEFGEVLDYGDVASLEKNDSSVPNLEKTPLRVLNVAFSPSNNSTKTLMKHFKDCARIDNGKVTGYQSERDLLLHSSNDTVALIFDHGDLTEPSKHLRYKIVAKDFGRKLWFVQACVDRSVEKMERKTVKFGTFSLKRMFELSNRGENPAGEVIAQLTKVISLCILIALAISLLVKSSRASRERFLGVQVLLSMNGASTAESLLSWIVSGVVFDFLFVVLPTIYMAGTTYNGERIFFYHGNVLVIGLMFLVHLSHLLTFGLHVSAYFTKGVTMTFGLLLVHLGSSVLRYCLKNNWLPCLPYLGIAFPGLLLIRAIEEIVHYEMIRGQRGIGFNNVFKTGDDNYGFGGSVGMVIILSVVGLAFHFLMATYINAVHPGKYGTAEYPLFFIDKFYGKRRVKPYEDLIESTNQKLFEPVKGEVYKPAVQMRSLKKTYLNGLFNKSQVHALRGVSMDYYQGQITVLLGHNGAGKTSLISILSGMMDASDGFVLVHSKDLKTHATEIRTDIGLCPQKNMAFPNLSVREQLLVFAMLKGKDETRGKIEQSVIALLNGLKIYDKRHALPKELSEGQKRRLSVAMSMIRDTSILILDEPTSGLDPENRRIVWDILLKMKGHKTVIISTHDMEEADILGDRIAIMHTGQLISYGTPFFLKKILGEGNVQVELSTESWCDSDEIIAQFDSETIVVNKDRGKLVLSTKSKPELPDLLDNVENRKKELGVTGLGVSHLTLEQVFLKITEEVENSIESTKFTDESSRSLSERKYQQIVRGLSCKKVTYMTKNIDTMLGMLFLTIISIYVLNLIIKVEWVTKREFEYESRDVFHNSGGPMLRMAEIDFTTSDKNATIINAVVSNNQSDGLSSSKARNISIILNEYNPVADVLLAHLIVLVFFSAITLFVLHPNRESLTQAKHLQRMSGVSCLTYWGTMFVIDLVVLGALVVLVVTSIVVIDWKFNLRMYSPKEILLSLLLFGSLAVNSLPFVYTFSFMNKKTSTVVQTLLYLTLVSVITDPIAFVLTALEVGSDLMELHKHVTYLLPQVSFVRGLVSLMTTIKLNSRCRTLPHRLYSSTCDSPQDWEVDDCCTFECKSGECGKYKPFFDVARDDRFQSQGDHKVPLDNFYVLSESLIYLGVTSLLYLSVLAVLEYKLVDEFLALSGEPHVINYPVDEQVEAEKTIVAEIIAKFRANTNDSPPGRPVNSSQSDDPAFLVYELQKRYGELQAVKDVTFRINQRECFGLLGVNGSGKSTTFRMMTGYEIPDHGVMYVGDRDYGNSKVYFLSRLGYCPQNDALIDSLNSYDHLRLFARLRGVPEAQVEDEARLWIERLNLGRCADQPSGDYSGGSRRRLSVAVALVGTPDLVLMDEPTTGVDPGARRSLWAVIQSRQVAGQAVVLTSHSMEECEVLCNRLAIMVDGKIVCVGGAQELKQRFGADYIVRVQLDAEKSENQVAGIKEDARKLMDCEVADENMGHMMFLVKPDGTSWRKMHDAMNNLKDKYDCVQGFTVSSSTLEQLFLQFAKTAQNRNA